MIIIRDRFFSKEEDEKKKQSEEPKKYGAKDALADTGIIAGGLGLRKIGTHFTDKLKDKADEKTAHLLDTKEYSPELRKENDILVDKLVKGAREVNKDNPVSIKLIKNGYNSASIGMPAIKLDNIAKELTPEERELYYKSGHIGKSILSVPKAAVLAHEIGHNQLSYESGLKNIPGRIAHILPVTSTTTGAGNLAEMLFPDADTIPKKVGKGLLKNAGAITTGLATDGAVYTDDEGKIRLDKKSLGTAAGAIALDTLSVPLMEAMASRRGLKLLKKHGASEKYLNAAKKDLKAAWGTYGAKAAEDAVKDISGGIIGLGTGVLREKFAKDPKNHLVKNEKGVLVNKDPEVQKAQEKQSAYELGLLPAALSGYGILKNSPKIRKLMDKTLPDMAGFSAKDVVGELTEAEKKKLPELEKKIEELMKKKRNKAIIRTSLLGAAGLTGAHLYNRWKDKKEQEKDK